MFLERLGERFRLLLECDGGGWIISYDKLSEPFYVSAEELLTMKRIEAPDAYVAAVQLFKSGAFTEAERMRYEMIEPLLSDDEYISNRKKRKKTLRELAAKYQTTPRRLNKIYIRFLATSRLIAQKTGIIKSNGKYEREFLWAIKTYYFSSRRISLRDTYCNMLVALFTAPDGTLMDDIPSFNSFRKYYFKHNLHKTSQRDISRTGLSDYQRNKRLLCGSAMGWRDKIGTYQMDATIADIYLVSRFDKSVIGRPYIYLAVDTATQLIAGIYVGLDSGDTAVMACLRNAAEDKAAYCAAYGISIEQWQWPSHGLPNEIVSDKGSEFLGTAVDDLCVHYGITAQSLPPFRPDGKGLVEKMFDLLQQRYKPLLRGKGVIEADARERWAIDYRAQAVLNIDEFTKILIHCVLYLNTGRIIESFAPSSQMVADDVKPLAVSIWNWMERNGRSALLDIEKEKLDLFGLPKVKVKIARKGIFCQGLWYSDREMQKYGFTPGLTVSVLYNPQNVDEVYIELDYGNFLRVPLSKGTEQFAGISFFEYDLFHKKQSEQRKRLEREEIEARIAAMHQISEIAEHAGPPAGKKVDGSIIEENRKREKEKWS